MMRAFSCRKALFCICLIPDTKQLKLLAIIFMRNLFKTCVFLIITVLLSCKNKTLFQQVSSSHSGIHFENKITESDSINPLDITNIYNGGGVGIGDFNNDGLQDVYFTGSLVPNKLYLNKGDLT